MERWQLSRAWGEGIARGPAEAASPRSSVIAGVAGMPLPTQGRASEAPSSLSTPLSALQPGWGRMLVSLSCVTQRDPQSGFRSAGPLVMAEGISTQAPSSFSSPSGPNTVPLPLFPGGLYFLLGVGKSGWPALVTHT